MIGTMCDAMVVVVYTEAVAIDKLLLVGVGEILEIYSVSEWRRKRLSIDVSSFSK